MRVIRKFRVSLEVFLDVLTVFMIEPEQSG